MKFRAMMIAVASAALAGNVGAQEGGGAAMSWISANYSDPASWICRPDTQGDVCDAPLDAAVVEADGEVSLEAFEADPDAPIDCFYIYPTVSSDEGMNSDMQPDAAEQSAVMLQAGRFGAECRVFAPIYRQVTSSGLTQILNGGADLAGPWTRAYEDVAAAWKHYLAQDNGGRGVVLVGHSQGAGMLRQLLHQEIAGSEAEGRIVSAMLIGAPDAAGLANEFEAFPLCESETDTQCLVAYNSFRAGAPAPSEGAMFGRPAPEDVPGACVNPADPSGGAADLDAYLATGTVAAGAEPGVWVAGGDALEPPFVKLPGLIVAECVDGEEGAYLAVEVEGDEDDPRADDIGGDLMAEGEVLPDWGLHLIDVNLALGDLVSLAGSQGDAWLAAQNGE